MSEMSVNEILERFKAATEEPYAEARQWKEETGGKVVGILAMQLPQEIAHAAGAFPLILQEDSEPVTLGHGLIYPFYCGYVRSIANQIEAGDLDFIDEFVVGYGASCVQGLAIGDIIREELGNKAYIDGTQISSFVSDACSFDDAVTAFSSMKANAEAALGATISNEALIDSIKLFNEDRALMRQVYELRDKGCCPLSTVQLMQMVQSSMVMDKATHVDLMKDLVAGLDTSPVEQDGIRVYLSGHFCQAPKIDILNLIEQSGAVVVDDDFYHGYRYIAQEVPTDEEDAIADLARAYVDKDKIVPCPTRIDPNADWDKWLLEKVQERDAKGMIILQAKYCEPHMFYFPEIKETFEAANMPYLLLQTEHEVVSLEAMRTRVETFIEMLKRS